MIRYFQKQSNIYTNISLTFVFISIFLLKKRAREPAFQAPLRVNYVLQGGLFKENQSAQAIRHVQTPV